MVKMVTVTSLLSIFMISGCAGLNGMLAQEPVKACTAVDESVMKDNLPGHWSSNGRERVQRDEGVYYYKDGTAKIVSYHPNVGRYTAETKWSISDCYLDEVVVSSSSKLIRPGLRVRTRLESVGLSEMVERNDDGKRQIKTRVGTLD
ncbi:hypothetical protein [Spongiibacter tropicus]|uniref:hypothetical protein n=1 Tax=Spongiibacter tropicus TaxID=454602 RepID=UPI0035BE511E